jgi:hypothetical protein
LITVAVLALGGCAAQPPAAVAPRQRPLGVYTQASAAALVMDPPVLAGNPRLDLSRDDRGPAAFAGFEDSSTTFYYLGVDDWYSDFNSGRDGQREDFERHAVSETYGVIHK